MVTSVYKTFLIFILCFYKVNTLAQDHFQGSSKDFKHIVNNTQKKRNKEAYFLSFGYNRTYFRKL